MDAEKIKLRADLEALTKRVEVLEKAAQKAEQETLEKAEREAQERAKKFWLKQELRAKK